MIVAFILSMELLRPALKLIYMEVLPVLNHTQYTVERHYNVLQYNTILPTPMQWLSQNVNETLNPQKTPHSSPIRASIGASFMSNLDEIDCVIIALHCIRPHFIIIYIYEQLSQNGGQHNLKFDSKF